MKDLKQTIEDIYTILGDINALYESNDLGGLERSKSELGRLGVPLEAIYHDSNSFYLQAKEYLISRKAEIYKKNRDEGQNIEDAKNNSRLDTIELLKEMNRQKLRRDKSRGLKEQVTEVKIDLATKIKYMREEAKYG